MAILASLGKYKNTGLLIIRIGLGVMFIFHGYPKLLSGPQGWEGLGGSMKNVGINFFSNCLGIIGKKKELSFEMVRA